MHSVVSLPTHPDNEARSFVIKYLAKASRFQPLDISCDVGSNAPVRIILSPGYLRDLVRNLDITSAVVLFEFYADKLYCETEAEVFQATEIHANASRRDEINIDQSLPQGIRVCYRVEAMRKMIPMLATAEKAVLWVDSQGVMQIQMMIKKLDVPAVFTDFMVGSPLNVAEC